MSFINHLESINKLRNQYFAVRHGESEANVARLISSNPQIGGQTHGLSSNGRKQVEENTKLFVENHPGKTYVIVSSDFRRANETATIVIENLSNAKLKIQIDTRLRERFFGTYDGTSDENYPIIWKNDEENPQKNIDELVEPVESVRERTTSLIKDLEEKYEDQIIFLVSHGDSLQILQTAFERIANANQQRSLKHLERAEFRPLILK